MSGNSIGKLFTLTTFGESHGPALGGVIDGCPPGLALSEADIQQDLERRRPGKTRHTTQRRELDEVKICTGYRINGTVVDQFPSQIDDLKNAEPIYEILPGWQEDLTGARNESDLPANAIGYIDRIGELLGRPVTIVSVGPDREQTIFRTDRTKPAPCPPSTQQERATV
jgi:hypothetical protein